MQAVAAPGEEDAQIALGARALAGGRRRRVRGRYPRSGRAGDGGHLGGAGGDGGKGADAGAEDARGELRELDAGEAGSLLGGSSLEAVAEPLQGDEGVGAGGGVIDGALANEVGDEGGEVGVEAGDLLAQGTGLGPPLLADGRDGEPGIGPLAGIGEADEDGEPGEDRRAGVGVAFEEKTEAGLGGREANGGLATEAELVVDPEAAGFRLVERPEPLLKADARPIGLGAGIGPQASGREPGGIGQHAGGKAGQGEGAGRKARRAQHGLPSDDRGGDADAAEVDPDVFRPGGGAPPRQKQEGEGAAGHLAAFIATREGSVTSLAPYVATPTSRTTV